MGTPWPENARAFMLTARKAVHRRLPTLERIVAERIVTRRNAAVAFLAMLYAAGVFHWLFVFDAAAFRAKDWPLIAQYHSVLRDALSHGTIPYLMSYTDHYTDRFLALPETPLSPQFLLLPFLSDAAFHRFNILLLYSIGFCGLLLLRRHLRLSAIPFLFLYLLFNFNGYIVSRVAIGHTMWYGYFFLPFFHYYVLSMVEEPLPERSRIFLIFVLFLMILQGSFHLYTWCLMYLAAIAVFNPRMARPALYVIAGALLICLFRFVPAAVTLRNTPLPFITGFPSLGFFLDALTTVHDFRDIRTYGVYDLGWWEFDCYIGIVGLGLLVYFCGLIRLKEKGAAGRFEYRELEFPNLLLILLCFERVYAVIPHLSIPLLSAQRISARFIIVPLTICAILAALRMSQYLTRERPKGAARVFILVCVALLAWNLCDHSAAWQIVDADHYFLNENPRGGDMASTVFPPMNDPGIRGYVRAVQISTLVSLLVFFFFVWRAYLTTSSRRRR